MPGGNALPQKTATVHKRDKGCPCVQSRIQVFFQVLVEAARREGKKSRGCGFRMWLLDSSVSRTGAICLVVKGLWKYNAKLAQSRIYFLCARARLADNEWRYYTRLLFYAQLEDSAFFYNGKQTIMVDSSSYSCISLATHFDVCYFPPDQRSYVCKKHQLAHAACFFLFKKMGFIYSVSLLC